MLGKFYHTTIEKTMSVNALSINRPNMAALSTRNSTLLPNALNTVNNAAKNIGKNVTVAANNVAVAANNAVKSVNTALNSSFTNMGNSFANAAKNTTKNLGLEPAVNTIQNATKNTGAKIANTLKALNTSLSVPIEESIDAVPSEGLSLGVSLPLILGIGLLVVLLVLFVVFRQQIAMAFQSAYDSVYNTVYGPSESTPTPTPTDSSVTLEPGAEAQPIPPPEATESVINKVINARKSVFNVATNKYTYADAEPLCKALGAELATYDQVKQAWDDGADWCNYGWVKGQRAVYPTQPGTYENMQKGPKEQRQACGKPGVNGGYFDNPDLRFGVTCYGVKPPQKEHDKSLLPNGEANPFSPDAMEYDKRVAEFKADSQQIGILPFGDGRWDEA
jgi:hypothetical protein